MATATSTHHRRLQQHLLGRTLHLLDIENLAGGAATGTAGVHEAIEPYRATVTVHPDDHVVIGSGPTLAFAAKAAWPGAQLVIGRGVDGADRALLAATDPRFVADHYDRVVIGSGDHAFAGLVSDLRARGLVVLVTGRTGSMSIDLRRLTTCRPLAVARAS